MVNSNLQPPNPQPPTPVLYVVPTPIGNLKDITLRALEVLKSVDLIACEDTRQTKKLLQAYEFKTDLLSYHEHTSEDVTKKLIALLEEGKGVALVSDGGMPLISDPGFELVSAAVKKGIKVECLPGANAAITALAASGLAVDEFSFLGFLPQKSGSRKNRLAKYTDREETLIFYESPFRLVKSLADIKEVFDDREAVIARELTKKFEEIARGYLSELIKHFSNKTVKGEIVILVSGKGRKEVIH